MSHCRFTIRRMNHDGTFRLRCSECGFVIRRCPNPPELTFALCRSSGQWMSSERAAEFLGEHLPCMFRGRPKRQEQCATCGGEQRLIAVYECALHGECALQRIRSYQDVRQCIRCPDRTPSVDSAAFDRIRTKE